MKATRLQFSLLIVALLGSGGCDAPSKIESRAVNVLEGAKSSSRLANDVCDFIGEEGIEFNVDVIDAFGKTYDILDLKFDDGESFKNFFSVVRNKSLPFVINEGASKANIVFIEYVPIQSRSLREKNYVDPYFIAPTAYSLGNERLVQRYCKISQRCEKFRERPPAGHHKGFWQKDANNRISRTFCFIARSTTSNLQLEGSAMHRHGIEAQKFHYADCFFRAMGIRGILRPLKGLSAYDFEGSDYLSKFTELSLQGYSNKIESLFQKCEGG